MAEEKRAIVEFSNDLDLDIILVIFVCTILGILIGLMIGSFLK